MKKRERFGLVIFGVLILAVCAMAVIYLVTGRELTNEMMFGTLGGLVTFFSMIILSRLERLSGGK